MVCRIFLGALFCKHFIHVCSGQCFPAWFERVFWLVAIVGFDSLTVPGHLRSKVKTSSWQGTQRALQGWVIEPLKH